MLAEQRLLSPSSLFMFVTTVLQCPLHVDVFQKSSAQWILDLSPSHSKKCSKECEELQQQEALNKDQTHLHRALTYFYIFKNMLKGEKG